MFSTFIQRVAPVLLAMIASSGIAKARPARVVSYGGPALRYNMQGNGTTLVRVDAKLGRNDVCQCGSGKKFKKCCGS